MLDMVIDLRISFESCLHLGYSEILGLFSTANSDAEEQLIANIERMRRKFKNLVESLNESEQEVVTNTITEPAVVPKPEEAGGSKISETLSTPPPVVLPEAPVAGVAPEQTVSTTAPDIAVSHSTEANAVPVEVPPASTASAPSEQTELSPTSAAVNESQIATSLPPLEVLASHQQIENTSPGEDLSKSVDIAPAAAVDSPNTQDIAVVEAGLPIATAASEIAEISTGDKIQGVEIPEIAASGDEAQGTAVVQPSIAPEAADPLPVDDAAKAASVAVIAESSDVVEPQAEPVAHITETPEHPSTTVGGPSDLPPPDDATPASIGTARPPASEDGLQAHIDNAVAPLPPVAEPMALSFLDIEAVIQREVCFQCARVAWHMQLILICGCLL